MEQEKTESDKKDDVVIIRPLSQKIDYKKEEELRKIRDSSIFTKEIDPPDPRLGKQ